ncbi:Multicopper oxidase with three cupredoxin domains (includes cell division protein FtsP and spore coat protein CotA) [Palleronia pelagia]|uniref:Multicopper oxidase with three cupredoxin domains (Includes cell division protein FtsP and spore coat protein CotA) n=1 Tax=Palleronia pelagia TaxID=387096 RepID=A0A1H8LXT6_9RHOB|nr:Multicopper oxidase with three cupredoxin domains (includes cell division protein FtsP and spore coat protein CotA) [Palleronia pelagia]
MRATRRAFLGGAVATAGLPLIGPAIAATAPKVIEPKPVSHQLAPDGYPKTAVWAYDGASPGPEIRLGQGARLERRLVNGLDQPTTIHWHGIRVPNGMDGVPDLTQTAVAPGESFDYAFDVPDAGTYWYHAHWASPEQVGRGLHGPLIIEEAESAPDIDADLVLALDDWLLNEAAQIEPNFAIPMQMSHGGRIGNFVTTNARHDFTQDVQQHQRLRLRLINMANARIFPLALQGLDGWVVAYDGMPLAQPEKVTSELVMGPAQRIDLLVDVTAAEGGEAYLVRLDDDGGMVQAAFPVTARASLTRRPDPVALPPNPGHAMGTLGSAQTAPMKIEGGAMGRLSRASVEGREMGFREMIGQGQFWAMAGQAGLHDTPLVTASMGETVRIPIENDTVFPHAMHLHGMHFREVLGDGAMGPMRDTLLIAARERREIAFVADNPGDWLFHCHMLGHAASGMMQWVRVV